MGALRKLIVIAFITTIPHSVMAKVVASVGSKNISLKDFQQKYNEMKERTMVNVPSQKDFLQELIRYEIGLQEAKRTGIQKDSKVQERYEQLLYQAFLEKQLGDKVSKIKVTESDMKKYYRNNPEIRASHILIEVPPNATAAQRSAARKRANDILQEVKKSKKPFEELVTLYTDDSITKRSGGDIGWQTRLTITPAFYNAANRLKEGQIGGPVETIYGYHIIKLVDRNPYQKANKRQLRQVVFEIKRKELFDALFSKLSKKYPVKVNTKLLN
tara:strand:+ start:7606 stop:8421 length:816 start_codon:yes stop_codon:yes gene_type:complete